MPSMKRRKAVIFVPFYFAFKKKSHYILLLISHKISVERKWQRYFCIRYMFLNLYRLKGSCGLLQTVKANARVATQLYWPRPMHSWRQETLNLCNICSLLSNYSTFETGLMRVFWDSANLVNLLKPTGHVMHQQFNIQQLYVLPTLYLCVLYLFENKQRLVPLTA